MTNAFGRRNECIPRRLVAVMVAMIVVGVPGATRAAQLASPPPFRADVVLVGFKAGVSAANMRTALTASRATETRTMGNGVHVVRVPSGQVLTAVASLKANASVRYAEPDYVQSESGVPNDPSFGLQWGYQNTGQTVNGITGIASADEHVAPAWDVSTGTRSVVVAEVDSGVQYTHPDLAANVWSNPGGVGGCALGTRGYNVLSATCDPMDDETGYHGHGTHVAGIIGAVGNNGTGVTGVNWQTTILPVKWLDSSGFGYTSDLITALDWILQAKRAGVNVRVVNDSATFFGTASSLALSDEIDLLGSNDILFVTAAGNTGDNNDDPSVGRYPCRYGRTNEICVTASNQSDTLPSWANHGANTVDLAAPGDNTYSTLLTSTYGYISGGSMASPQVAGAAALILSRGYLSVSALKADILNNVDALPALSGLVRTGGRLDICKALPGCSSGQPPTGTFGTASVGTSTDSTSANRKRVNSAQLTEVGNVTKLSVYLQPAGKSGQQVLKGVIYADQDGAPGALLGVTNELTFHSTDPSGWYNLTFPAGIALQPGTYWIGMMTGGTGNIAAFRWTTVASSRRYNVDTYTSGPSNPFGALTTDSERMSIYATYTISSASAPVNSVLPAISGTGQQGQTLTASNGTWTNSPTSYTYQWQRCDSGGANCASIGSAAAQTYLLAAADVGSTIRVVVTATNAGGSTPATSSQTAPITAPASSGTFGTTTVGPTPDSMLTDRKRVNRYSIGVSGTLTKLSVYLQPTGTSGQQVLRGVIYADQGGAPGGLLGVTNEITFHSTDTAGWYDLSFPAGISVQPGTYWIGMMSGSTSYIAAFRWTSVAGSRAYNANPYASGPSSVFGTASTDAEQMSIYATYSMP